MTAPRPALPPFQRLLDEHGESLWRWCRAVLGPHDGDDLFQDVVLAALRAYPLLKHDANLRSWLFTIAHHRRVDRFRADGRMPTPTDELVAESRVVAEGRQINALVEADHAEAVAGTVDSAALWSRVARLPDKQRLAVTLRFVADLSYAQVGAVIDISEAAARQNVRAGLATLRRELVP